MNEITSKQVAEDKKFQESGFGVWVREEREGAEIMTHKIVRQ